MHPNSFFSYVSSRRFIPVLIVLVLFFAGFFYILALPIGRIGQKQQPLVSPTPIAPSKDWQTQDIPARHFVLQYPTTWKQQKNDVPNDPVRSFTFVVDGVTYRFTDSPPSGQDVNGEASLSGANTATFTPVTYGGRSFLREVLSIGKQPVLIRALPNEQGFVFDMFSMTLPPVDTQKYMDLFDQMLNRLHFTGALQPPLTPLPTLGGARTVYLDN